MSAEVNQTHNSASPSGRSINIFIDDEPPITGARIKVIGVGGGGGNAVQADDRGRH